MLRPGVPGLSETIRVRSIVGRFSNTAALLLRQRGDEEGQRAAPTYVAQPEPRVEVLAPVKDPQLRKYLKDFLASYLRDNAKARVLRSDGSTIVSSPRRARSHSRPMHFEGAVSMTSEVLIFARAEAARGRLKI